MKRYIGLFITMIFLCISVVFAKEIKINKVRVFKNCYVSYIDEKKLFIKGKKYILSPDLTIIDSQGLKIDKKTIAGVGFISKADVIIKKIRVRDRIINQVLKIVILEMNQ